MDKTKVKDSIRRILTFVLAFAIVFAFMPATPAMANSEPATIDGINYLIDKDEGWAKIKGYEGSTEQLNAASVSYDSADYPVTGVKASAFKKSTQLENVNLPNVTAIESDAFYKCTGLSEISLPELKTIGDYAFVNTKLSDITLPKVTTIGGCAFQDCLLLEEVSLPVLTEIGDYAFYECTSLKKVSLPKLSVIGKSAFKKCESLKAVDFSNVTSIGSDAFGNCKSLESLNLEKAASIGAFAFSNCTGLKSVTIGDKNCTVDEIVFDGVNGALLVLPEGWPSSDLPDSDGYWHGGYFSFPHKCVYYKEKVNGKAAACTEDGWKDYYKCTDCDKLYSDEKMTESITDISVWKNGEGKISKLGHNMAFTAADGTITAACSRNPAHKASLTLTASDVKYSGSKVTYSENGTEADIQLEGVTDWTEEGLSYEIKYYISYTDEDNNTPTDMIGSGASEEGAAPVNPGDYIVVLKAKDGTEIKETLTRSFSINAETVIETIPKAGAITYGQKLGESIFTGGVAKHGGTVVPGVFTWADSDAMPKVSDSDNTDYDVTFTPSDTANYNSVVFKEKVTVNRKALTARISDQSVTRTPGADFTITPDMIVLEGVLDSDKGKVKVSSVIGGNNPSVSTAGTYELSVTGIDISGEAAENYQVTDVTKGTLTVKDPTVSVKEVKLDIPEKTELTSQGETLQLSASVTPVNAANKTLTWKSSDESVVTVDSTGKVTAIGEGTAAITVSSANGKTAALDITVKLEKEQGDENPDDNEKQSGEDTESRITEAKAKANSLKLNSGLKVTPTGKKVSIAWGKVADADGYLVYASYCGGDFGNAVKTIKDPEITSLNITGLNGKAIDRKKAMKVYVMAYKLVDGKKVAYGKTINAHISGNRSSKYTNVKEIRLTSKSKVTLKEGKSSFIKAKLVLADENKERLKDTHAKQFRYASSNTGVASVNANGKITAKEEGSCYIYVYAINGYAKKVKVTVVE